MILTDLKSYLIKHGENGLIDYMIEFHLKPRPKWFPRYSWRWLVRHLFVIKEIKEK